VIVAPVSPTKGRAPFKVECSAQVEGDYSGVQWIMGTNVLSTNLDFAWMFEEPIQTELRLVVFPKEPGAANLERAIPITITPPLPFWMKWVVVGFIVMASGGIAIRRLWPERLLGDVAWQYSGRSGQTSLGGHVLKLAELQIPGWQPALTYVLRNKNGHRILSENGLEVELSHKKTFRLEGVTFTYLNEAEAL
jgi:hypothetical protein